MKRILITGGAGFIGSSIALKLIQQKYEVTVFDSLSEQIHGKNPDKSSLYVSIKDKVRFIHGSVCSVQDWKNALENQEVVIHLAAETGTGQSMYEIEKYTNVNISGTSILLDLLTNSPHSVKKVIVASSRAIYGEGKYSCAVHGDVYPGSRNENEMMNGDFSVKCPFCGQEVELVATDEESKINPSSIYGITKEVQEQMVHCVCKALGISSVSFRYQNVYGPGQSLKNPYTGILSIFSTRMRQNKPINIFEDGKESRDFVYIDDVVDATILGLESKVFMNEEFNIGSGKATTVYTVVEHLKRIYSSLSTIEVSGRFRIGDIRHNYADITKATTILGYKPKVDFETGIQRFCEWVLQQPNEEDYYDKSIVELKAKGMYK